MTDTLRDEHIDMCRVAEQAERHEEMVGHIKAAIMLNPELTQDERNLFVVSYKNCVGSRRYSLRVLSSITAKEKARGREVYVNKLDETTKKIEGELEDICTEVIDIIDNQLIPATENVIALISYYKTKGDHYRYLCGFYTGERFEEAKQKGLESYETALEKSKEVSVTNPVRLSLILNFSVFHNDVMQDTEEAVRLSEATLAEAIQSLNELSEDSFTDSTVILQLIKDNLTNWTE
eukprot:TRINITY_DN7085_c0_g1_i1.p1 TRINITY_DN7085_c0_g1~~TRINITY_DN7085_c0_g1_i1.p1  ORF type:complete len:235 (+),score=51.55 TRINITY_DN7085_c0_g1_i1:55-759(+)